MGKGTVLEAKSTQEKRNCPHSLDKYRHFGGERCIKKKKIQHIVRGIAGKI